MNRQLWQRLESTMDHPRLMIYLAILLGGFGLGAATLYADVDGFNEDGVAWAGVLGVLACAVILGVLGVLIHRVGQMERRGLLISGAVIIGAIVILMLASYSRPDVTPCKYGDDGNEDTCTVQVMASLASNMAGYLLGVMLLAAGVATAAAVGLNHAWRRVGPAGNTALTLLGTPIVVFAAGLPALLRWGEILHPTGDYALVSIWSFAQGMLVMMAIGWMPAAGALLVATRVLGNLPRWLCAGVALIGAIAYSPIFIVYGQGFVLAIFSWGSWEGRVLGPVLAIFLPALGYLIAAPVVLAVARVWSAGTGQKQRKKFLQRVDDLYAMGRLDQQSRSMFQKKAADPQLVADDPVERQSAVAAWFAVAGGAISLVSVLVLGSMLGTVPDTNWLAAATIVVGSVLLLSIGLAKRPVGVAVSRTTMLGDLHEELLDAANQQAN